MKHFLCNAALVITTFMPVAVSAQLAGSIDNTSLSSGIMRVGLGSAVGSNIVPNDLGNEYMVIGAIASDLNGAAYGKSPSPYPTRNLTQYNIQKTNPPKNIITATKRSHQYRKQAYIGGGARAYSYNPNQHHNITPRPTHSHTILSPSIHQNTYSHIVLKSQPTLSYSAPHHAKIQKEIIRKERIVIPSECPSGTILQSDGRCMEQPKTVYAPPPKIIPSNCPIGTLDQGDGTCLEPTKTIIKSSPKIIPSQCPKGTIDQDDGTCLEPAKKVIAQAPIIIPANCPAGTIDKKNGTCLEPAKKVIKERPVIIPATCPAGTMAQGAGICVKPPKTIVESTPIIIASSCPSNTIDQGNGTCLEPAKTVIKKDPIILSAQCPIGTLDQGNGTCLEPKKIISQTSERVTAKCPKGTTRQLDGICLASEQIAEHSTQKYVSHTKPSVPAYVPIVMPEFESDDEIMPKASPHQASCQSTKDASGDEDNTDELAGGYDPLTLKCDAQQH